MKYTRYPLTLWIFTLLTVFLATLTYLFTYLIYLSSCLYATDPPSLTYLPTYIQPSLRLFTSLLPSPPKATVDLLTHSHSLLFPVFLLSYAVS